ncbi:MAG TPA: NAD(P)-dependent alcohol dehydrogenase [Myxococcaceae bacterium]|nr:NAD(P)-dependent alcohol dehydrogenase [Myxococcaceae bacterium]
MTTMNAIVQPAYGSAAVLRLEAVERPVPGNGEVLVRVRAASVCRGDVHLLTGTPYLLRLMFGLRRPKRRVAGQQVAGTVEAVGPGVTTLKPGDEVFGQTPGGAFAEYVCTPAALFAPKPANLTFEQAAAVPVSGMTALQALRDVGHLEPGQKVLINGASGGVGCFAVQIAKALGAEVTAVCSTRHVDKVRSLGADRVVDYTREDFARGSERYDAMLDLVGNRSLADCKAVLQPKGVFLSSAGSPGGNWIGPIVWMLKVMLAGMFGSQKMAVVMSTPKREDLLSLRSLIEAGKVTPVIERRYALREVPAALGHVAEGHSQGTTVISV